MDMYIHIDISINRGNNTNKLYKSNPMHTNIDKQMRAWRYSTSLSFRQTSGLYVLKVLRLGSWEREAVTGAMSGCASKV